MSQENVEAVRRSLDAFNRGDRNTWLALRHQDFEIIPISDWPDARMIRGREAAWDFYREVADTLSMRVASDTHRASYANLVDAGADKVMAHQRHGGRGRTSGVDVEVDYWTVITFRDEKMLRDEWFGAHAEALEAAGLRE
jgi:ketosteroid isomerase-like protein